MPSVNKVVYGNNTLIDLTGDNVTANDVVAGKSFHLGSGVQSTGALDITKFYSTDDTAETTLDDADYVPFYDSSATGKRKTLWSNIKSKLKTYFDTIYKGINTYDAWENVTNKPFENIADSPATGLSVDNGWLSANIHSVSLRVYDGLRQGEGTGFTQLWVNGQAASGGDNGKITGTQYFQKLLTLSTSTTTQVTFTEEKITASSVIEVFTGRYSGDISGEQNVFPYNDIYATDGSCTITFPSFTSAIQIIVRIYIK